MEIDPSRVFRFCVGNKEERSLVWRLWTQKNDCYLGAREIAGQYKASFHEDGRCQIGISRSLRKMLIENPNWASQSRLYDIWYVDINSGAPRLHPLIELIIPRSHLENLPPIKENKEVYWLNSGDYGEATSFGIFRQNAQSSYNPPNVVDSEVVVKRLPLDCGASVVVIYRLISWTKEHESFLSKNLSNMDLSENSGRRYSAGDFNMENPGIRAMMCTSIQNKRYWFEFSPRKFLQSKNT